jgi:hypothetical protein
VPLGIGDGVKSAVHAAAPRPVWLSKIITRVPVRQASTNLIPSTTRVMITQDNRIPELADRIVRMADGPVVAEKAKSVLTLNQTATARGGSAA